MHKEFGLRNGSHSFMKKQFLFSISISVHCAPPLLIILSMF